MPFVFRVLPENQFYIDTLKRLRYREKCIRIDYSTWLLRIEGCTYDPTKEHWDMIREGEVTGMLRGHLEVNGVMVTRCLKQVSMDLLVRMV